MLTTGMICRHTVIVGVRSANQVRPLRAFLNQSMEPVIVEVDVDPRLYTTASPARAELPFLSQIAATLVPHERVFYELQIGPSGVRMIRPQTVMWMVGQLRRYEVTGIAWRARPDLGLVAQIGYTYGGFRQAFKVREPEIELADANDGALARLLDKWWRCGVTDLIIPVRQDLSLDDYRQLWKFMRCAKVAHPFGLRLDGATSRQRRVLQRPLMQSEAKERGCGWVISLDYARAVSARISTIRRSDLAT